MLENNSYVLISTVTSFGQTAYYLHSDKNFSIMRDKHATSRFTNFSFRTVTLSGPSSNFSLFLCQNLCASLVVIMEKKIEAVGVPEAPSLSYALKLAISAALYLCHFVMGLGIDFLGSSLLEMRARFHTDIPTISKVFTVLTVSFCIGAF